MESTLSTVNTLIKYANDTNLLVPSDSDTNLTDEFDYIKRWANDKRMIINLTKTKELVFRRPNIIIIILFVQNKMHIKHVNKISEQDKRH